MLSKTLDRISFWSIFATIVFLPIFFIPFVQIPVEISKSLLVVVGLTVSMVAWAVARLLDGNLRLPKSKIFLVSLAVVMAMFFSAYFSEARVTSFFGLMFDVGTFWFIFSAFLLMLFASLTGPTEKQERTILKGFFVSSFVVLSFQILRYLLLGRVISFGLFGLYSLLFC
jgi:hypothetical protein